MRNMTLRNLQEVTGGILHGAKEVLNQEITAVVSDSRKVTEGSLFLCIAGEKADGHAFASKAMKAGALAVVAEKKLPRFRGPYLQVESTFEATKQIAEFYRKELDVTVVGVTGSVGKTSTKEFIAAVLSRRYRVHKTEGNFNNEWGVPFTIFGITEEHDVAVIEMGINHFGEMDRLAKMARPDVVVMTNIGQSHLEYLGSRDGILKAKSEIFNYLPSDGMIILNGDDDKLVSILGVKGVRPFFYGFDKLSTVGAERVRDHGLDGTEFDLVLRDGGGRMNMHIKLPIPGKHMIYNAMAAALTGIKMGVAPVRIKEALEEISAISGRNHILKTERFTILDDCYNASPSSMEASLDIVSNTEGRKVAILGDMFELGENSDKYHYYVGEYAGKTDMDVILCVGANSKKMFMGAKMGSDKKVEYYPTVDDCLARLPYLLEDGDIILVKASHGMHFSRIVDALSQMR